MRTRQKTSITVDAISFKNGTLTELIPWNIKDYRSTITTSHDENIQIYRENIK